MPTPPDTIQQLNDRLCAEAARLHKAISAEPDRYNNPYRQALTHQLVGIRTALCFLHDAERDLTVDGANPAGAAIVEWWTRSHPAEWTGDALRTRHAEQFYIVLHELLMASKYASPADLAQRNGLPRSTTHFAFSNPARSRWCTLEPIVKALDAHRDELWSLWEKAYQPPHKTIPPRGPGLTPRRT